MPILNGDHAHTLIARHCRQLVELQGPVLENLDSEPLRRMDLQMRRLHGCLLQFGPALDLPAAVSPKRLAKTRRRLTLAGDLDRLRLRLEGTFLPQAPEREVRRLKPVLRQLKRERQLAHDHLVTALRSSSHLEWLAQLQSWQRQPRYTPLGTEPLRHWLPEWAGDASALLLHQGWWLDERGEELASLRGLGECIEAVSDRLGNLPQPEGAGWCRWVGQQQRSLALLRELSDLDLLRRALDEQLRDGIERTVPQLDWLLEQHHLQCWRQWRQLAEQLLATQPRHQLQLLQLAAWEERSLGGRIRAGLIAWAARLR